MCPSFLLTLGAEPGPQDPLQPSSPLVREGCHEPSAHFPGFRAADKPRVGGAGLGGVVHARWEEQG